MRVHVLLTVAALLATAPARAFEPTGEVIFSARGAIGAGASFDADRLVGPAVNMTRQDGGWAGDLQGQNLYLGWQGDRKLTGPNVTLVYNTKGGKTKIEGLFYGIRFRIDVDQKKVHGKFGACSLDLKQAAPGLYRGDVGCLQGGGLPATARGTLKLLGEAASDNPPMPQLALALLAILPS